jgi:hypothetical protein
MNSRSRLHAERFVAAVLTLAVAASLPAIALIESLTVDPQSPNCDDEVTVSMEGYFPNACFLITGIDFVANGNTMGFFINALEYVGPGGCAEVIIPYEAQQSLGTLAEGDYLLVAHEIVYPTRVSGDDAYMPFTVCCTPAPDAVNGLRLAKTGKDEWLRFYWSNAAGASGYVLYTDDEPDGTFDESVGTAVTGLLGIEFLIPDGIVGEPQFFLVAGTNGCAEGPKR